MGVYSMGNTGGKFYIIDEGSDSAYIFNNFGEFMQETSARLALVDLNLRKIEVDVISILGNGASNLCDIFYSGYRGLVQLTYLDAVARVQKNFQKNKQNNIIFRVSRNENATQILILLRKGEVSVTSFYDVFGLGKENIVKLN